VRVLRNRERLVSLEGALLERRVLARKANRVEMTWMRLLLLHLRLGLLVLLKIVLILDGLLGAYVDVAGVAHRSQSFARAVLRLHRVLVRMLRIEIRLLLLSLRLWLLPVLLVSTAEVATVSRRQDARIYLRVNSDS